MLDVKIIIESLYVIKKHGINVAFLSHISPSRRAGGVALRLTWP